jgi:hypothetical protein
MCVIYTINHNPTKEDEKHLRRFKKLIYSEPNNKNYFNYFNLACSLWELDKLDEAELMFLKIVNSDSTFYTSSYYHTSDIPDDKITYSYVYGSFTSNYKNYSCRYLSKIYLERKNFSHALKYIKLADNLYKVRYNCGTGNAWYNQEIDGIYGLCYDGLQLYDTIIKRFLPNYSEMYNGVLVKALKTKYKSNEIDSILFIAENSIICVPDTFQSDAYTLENYGTKKETKTLFRYTSGHATTKLFGIDVEMVVPDLKDGDIVSKELFLKKFRESGFYKVLKINE